VRVSDFHFDLPEELIAQHPPAQRGSSRLLAMQRGASGGCATLSDRMFAELPQLLLPGDLLVLNDSRVMPARLFGRHAGERTAPHPALPTSLIEILLVEESADGLWRVLARPARKLRVGDWLEFRAAMDDGAGGSTLTAEVVGAGEYGERTLRFAPVEDFHAALEQVGHMPLPPYIRRAQADGPDTPEDLSRYQTVYASQTGSAAAPTAGLHFTPEILEELRAAGVEVACLTLHVGLGTFQPVRVSELADVRLHSERYTLPAATADALNRALRDRRRVISVGTTTTRTLEHIAAQAESVTAGNPFKPHTGSTSIFLAPGHRFRVVSGLLTNFHLPESTLLMLAAAFAAPTSGDGEPGDAGRDLNGGIEADRAEQGIEAMLAAYGHAIRHGYRFYSYGDCMLIL
jgi:S-adenosylmethionine:tRNA ribosyltransferase-isomerase